MIFIIMDTGNSLLHGISKPKGVDRKLKSNLEWPNILHVHNTDNNFTIGVKAHGCIQPTNYY